MPAHVSVVESSHSRTDNILFLKVGNAIYISEEIQKSNQDVFGDVYCQTSSNKKCVYLSTNKKRSFYDYKKVQSLLSRDEC